MSSGNSEEGSAHNEPRQPSFPEAPSTVLSHTTQIVTDFRDEETIRRLKLEEAPPSPKKRSARPKRTPKSLRFWLIFLSLCMSVFLAALEMMVISNALPTIVHDLNGTEGFVWIGAAYALSAMAFQPMYGGVAEIFGRRGGIITGLGIFAFGSALCGSAKSMTWLIAARTVQGIGGSGILSITTIIVSDLVPLQERGIYNGFIGLSWAIALAIGPLIGGVLAQHGQWRWVFYLNLPVCAVALVLVVIFLDLPKPPGTTKGKLAKMDWIGNFLIMSSSTAVVVAITFGGAVYPWKSAHVVTPLALGLLGIVALVHYEKRHAAYPIVPWALLSNQNSVSGYIQVFINSYATVAIGYFITAYYQACHGATPIGAGVNTLTMSLVLGPFVVLGGVSVTITQVYRPQLWFAWAVFLPGICSFTIWKADTSIATTMGLLSLTAAGQGIIYACTYFPVLAPLPVSENAHALAFFTFLRSFAAVWGLTIGGTIFQTQLLARLPEAILDTLRGDHVVPDMGTIYGLIPEISTLSEPLRTEVRVAFSGSFMAVWKMLTGVVAVGFLASLFMKDVPLQNVMDEKWGLQVADEETAAQAEKVEEQVEVREEA